MDEGRKSKKAKNSRSTRILRERCDELNKKVTHPLNMIINFAELIICEIGKIL